MTKGRPTLAEDLPRRLVGSRRSSIRRAVHRGRGRAGLREYERGLMVKGGRGTYGLSMSLYVGSVHCVSSTWCQGKVDCLLFRAITTRCRHG